MNTSTVSRRIPLVTIVIAGLTVLSALAGGHFYYQSQKERITLEKKSELQGIAALKVRQVEQWRNERHGDANIIFGNPLLSHHIEDFVRTPHRAALRTNILGWLRLTKESYRYTTVTLCGPAGELLLSTEQDDSLGSGARRSVLTAAAERRVQLSDLYIAAGQIRMNLAAPIVRENDPSRTVIAIVLLRIDPGTYLFPLLKTWPVPSRTFESILFRRDDGGDPLSVRPPPPSELRDAVPGAAHRYAAPRRPKPPTRSRNL